MLTVTERKELYSLLVQLFSYPDADLIERVTAAETAALAGRLSIPPLPGEGGDLTDLEPVYTSLFINRLGGVPAPPYGSVYLDADNQVMGPSALRVMQCYQDAGLVVDSPEPPDFLPTELEFLYFLVDCEGDGAVRAATNFFNELFSPWIAPFCQRVTTASPHPFYLWAASLLQTFCRHEAERFTLPCISPVASL